MATTSLWPIHNTGGRGVRTILNKLVEYAENGEKTTEGSGGKTPQERGGRDGRYDCERRAGRSQAAWR